jgi:two-component system cell cycle sensor histidine kinase/response regulator CckA
VVDDQDAVRTLAQRALESFGYMVLTARSGVEALTLARGVERIDVLLTDIVMPQLNGPQLVERFVAKYGPVCAIYMTGHLDDSTTALELNEEVQLLRKPFTPLDLVRQVQASLDASRVLAGIS